MGLAAYVPDDFIPTIKTMGEDHDVNVEDDTVIGIAEDDHQSP
jgi:hypothetical protein